MTFFRQLTLSFTASASSCNTATWSCLLSHSTTPPLSSSSCIFHFCPSAADIEFEFQISSHLAHTIISEFLGIRDSVLVLKSRLTCLPTQTHTLTAHDNGRYASGGHRGRLFLRIPHVLKATSSSLAWSLLARERSHRSVHK